jgi:hypothetical protein
VDEGGRDGRRGSALSLTVTGSPEERSCVFLCVSDLLFYVVLGVCFVFFRYNGVDDGGSVGRHNSQSHTFFLWVERKLRFVSFSLITVLPRRMRVHCPRVLYCSVQYSSTLYGTGLRVDYCTVRADPGEELQRSSSSLTVSLTM